MKVYISNTPTDFFLDDRHSTPFLYGGDKFEIVYSLSEADLIPIYYKNDIEIIRENLPILKTNNHKTQTILICSLFTATEYFDTPENIIDFFNENGFNAYFIHTNYGCNDDSLIFHDYMFNRQKAYFIEYDRFDLSNKLWSFKATKKMYELSDINEKHLTKKFLIPNKTYSTAVPDESHTPRAKFRQKLRRTILEEDCHFSDPENFIYLRSQEISDDILNDYHYYHGGMGFHPLANDYYQKTAVSVYVETLSSSSYDNKIITEKTFNPLIKGHFILPFSYAGYINDLKNIYGFVLPSWIDYSYDDIHDDNERYIGFMKSFTKLRFMDLQKLENLCNQDIDILKYNREVFYQRPYHSLHESIEKLINI